MPKKVAFATKEQLEHHYIVEMMSANEIAKKYQCSNRMVLDHMHRHGIPVRSARDGIRLRQSLAAREKSSELLKTWP